MTFDQVSEVDKLHEWMAQTQQLLEEADDHVRLSGGSRCQSEYMTNMVKLNEKRLKSTGRFQFSLSIDDPLLTGFWELSSPLWM